MKRHSTILIAFPLLLAAPAWADDDSRAPAANAEASRAVPAAVSTATQTTATAQDEKPTYYRVGKVVTMDADDTVINNAIVVVSGGKIESIAKAADFELPEGAEVHDFADSWLVPGFVEAHNHASGSGADLHDYVYLTNPGLRTRESIDPNTENDKRSRAGGVTSALMIPGSGTNMSGFGAIVKLGGKTMDELVIRSPGSLKIAQAGNPERYWWGVGRMLMNYNTRHTLETARDYHLAWEAYENGGTKIAPPYDPTYDEFRGLFRREFPTTVHTQGYQLVMTTIDMLANKLNIRTVLDHSTFDGWKVAPLVLEQGDVITMNGPRQFQFDRTQRKLHGNAARWWQGGIRKLGVNTDSPVIPQEELSYQAAMACWYGWKPYEALKGITKIASEALMIDDRLGSIVPGMDADFAIWSGDPIDPRSVCRLTVVDGKIVHNAKKNRRF